MPLYEYKCSNGHKFEVICSIADHCSKRICKECGAVADQIITTAPAVHGDYPPYECPVTGKVIEGKRAHEENLKRTGCRILEPGEREQYQKRQVAEEQVFEAGIEATIEQTIHEMPVEKREALTIDLQNGADLQFQRSTKTN